MKFILGKKLGMTEVFDEKGKVIPVTVIEVEPNVVVQVRTKEKDGYEAVQIGTGTKSAQKLTKQEKGHMKNLGNFLHLKEFRATKANDQELKVGDTLDASVFTPGDMVKVSGLNKGKGFAGGMKRHGFSGMPASHGHKHVRRHIGSIGQRFPQHTLKGKRMAGRMGGERITVRGLKVISIDAENGLVALKGAVPGNRGGLLEIRSLS